MPLYTFPGPPGGNPHFFVVVPHTSTRSKRIPQPESVFICQAIGDIGEGGSALVRGHYQIGIIAVMTYHRGGRDHRVLFTVIGNVQQTANELLITGHPLLLPLFTVQRIALFDHEAALGAHRDDDRILHHLRLHQPQYFRAKILASIRPAQTTPCHRTASQMDPFHLR